MNPDIYIPIIIAAAAIAALWFSNRIVSANKGPGDEEEQPPDAALMQDLRLSGDVPEAFPHSASGVYPSDAVHVANGRAARLSALLDLSLMELGRLDPEAEKRVRAMARKVCEQEERAA